MKCFEKKISFQDFVLNGYVYPIYMIDLHAHVQSLYLFEYFVSFRRGLKQLQRADIQYRKLSRKEYIPNLYCLKTNLYGWKRTNLWSFQNNLNFTISHVCHFLFSWLLYINNFCVLGNTWLQLFIYFCTKRLLS